MTAAPVTLRQRFGLRRFLHGNGPVDAPLCLDRRRIYILPTRAGLGFALLLLIMLIDAINYDNSLAYLLTFLLAGISVVSILHTYRGLPGLCLRLGQPVAVFAGEPAYVPLWVDNTANPARYAEVWLTGQGWVRIDPTIVIPPDRVDTRTDLARLQPDARLIAQMPAWLAHAWRNLGYRWDTLGYYWNQWVIGYNEDRQHDLLGRLGLGRVDWRAMAGLLFLVLTLVFGTLTIVLLWRRRAKPDPVRRIWQRFTHKLARHGLVCAPQEGALDFARRVG